MLTACALPGFLAGALVLEIREDFTLAEATLGVAFAVWWGVGSAASTPVAKVVERIGPVWAMRVAGGLAAASCLAVAALAGSALALILLLALGGLSLAFAAPGVNTLILRAVPGDAQGLAFGLVQSSLPIGLILAGLSVPLLAHPLGWRPTFLAAAALAAVAALAAPRSAPPLESPGGVEPSVRPDLRPLVLLAVGISLGTGAVGTVNAFFASGAPDAGVSATQVGLTSALASAAGVGVRIAAGLWVDRRDSGRALLVVSAMLAAGATGFGLLSAGSSLVYLAGATLVLTLGWSWMGLFTFAVVRAYSQAPEIATGVIQTGFFAGGTVAPIVFGLVVERSSFDVAWLLAGAGALVAAATVWSGRRLGSA